MPVATIQTPTDHIEFSAHDVCDRCGFQAYVQVFFPTGYLLFCAHHYKKNEQALGLTAKYVHDRRDLLEPTKPQDVE